MSEANDQAVEELSKSLKILKTKSDLHNETVPINRLPVELFCMLLEYLDRSELFLYESVCQRWANFVKAFVRNKLVISRIHKVRPIHWFYLDERCPPSSVMVRSDLNVIENSFLFGLKHLKIRDQYIRDYHTKNKRSLYPPLTNLNLINRLTALEVLEISRSPAGTISLPNLKYLAISYNMEYPRPILIDCPQLSSFKTKSSNLVFDFSPQTSISHLYVNEFSMENFEKLRNLAYLSVIDFKYNFKSEKYTEGILKGFPKLKAISVRSRSYSTPDSIAFKELLKEKQALGRAELVLIFCGVRIESEEQFLNSQTYGPGLTRLYLENYLQLYEAELKWIERIYYFDFEIPADFHQKFKYVREIKIGSRVDDEDRLIEFIVGFKRLDKLDIKREVQLVGRFYRKLNRSLSSISYLKIWIEPYEDIEDIDFEFLFELKGLAQLIFSEYEISDQLVRRLFDHFESFEVNYTIEEKLDNVMIRRAKKGSKFEFSVLRDHLETFDDLDGVIQHMDKNCRNPYNEIVVCDCSSEFKWCENDSYASNLSKLIYQKL